LFVKENEEEQTFNLYVSSDSSEISKQNEENIHNFPTDLQL
jgi:hypothetical protein